jgi:hypothetical protein
MHKDTLPFITTLYPGLFSLLDRAVRSPWAARPGLEVGNEFGFRVGFDQSLVQGYQAASVLVSESDQIRVSNLTTTLDRAQAKSRQGKIVGPEAVSWQVIYVFEYLGNCGFGFADPEQIIRRCHVPKLGQATSPR